MKKQSLDQFVNHNNLEVLGDKKLNEVQGGNIIWDLFVMIGEFRPSMNDFYHEIADKLGIPESERPS